MTTLTIPGVRVETRFDVLPPLPAASGIVGIAGIVDRRPSGGALTAVTRAGEVSELLGIGTSASMPELIHALAGGAAEVVVSPVAGGGVAFATLNRREGPTDLPVVDLWCRSPGVWGNELAVDVQGVRDAAGAVIRVTVRILRGGEVAESFDDLTSDPTAPNDLFESINRGSKLVVAVDPDFSTGARSATAGSRVRRPSAGTQPFAGANREVVLRDDGQTPKDMVLVRGVGRAAAGDGWRLVVTQQAARGEGEPATFTMEVVNAGVVEERFDDLVMDPDSERFMPFIVTAQSNLLSVRAVRAKTGAEGLPLVAFQEFGGGASPSVEAYAEAIDRLADDPRIDLVLASIDQLRVKASDAAQNQNVRRIHQSLVAHAVRMADDGSPRIAFGSVTRNEESNLDEIKNHSAAVRGRRFVLVSPSGAEGAVAGAVARLAVRDSPTFKPVQLQELDQPGYRDAELNRLLGPTINALVVQERSGRGVVVIKGIDTTGDQISVTRVADNCVREVKGISENFISRLNSDDTRTALKQQIIAMLTRLERDGSLVPSTDGKDPAFIVDVYSTQQDFAQGIVRIDLAVRPVRAIDYVYATIRVKN